MKKTYINPEMNTVQLDFTQQILAGSIIINSIDDPIDASDAVAPEIDFADDAPVFFDE